VLAERLLDVLVSCDDELFGLDCLDPIYAWLREFFSQDIGVERWMQQELARFESLYQDTFVEVEGLVSREALIRLASHSYGWHPDQYDMLTYLKRSIIRYRQAYSYILRQYRGRRISCLDIGGFWGLFPAVLKKLGYPVAMTEKYKYYAEGFDGIRDYLHQLGVTIYDVDPVLEMFSPSERFDLVSCMALLEHVPDSPRVLFENFRNSLLHGGGLILEVPNLAYWYKRKALLRGETVLCHIETIYRSQVPFIGHHHEYTRNELEWILKATGFSIHWFGTHNYSLRPWRRVMIHLLPMTFHEVFIVFARKQ
jgi:2-polyprenyl-3-methyl-5-hydroxy-6-metoxy-1,4-benzoquinol methylase